MRKMFRAYIFLGACLDSVQSDQETSEGFFICMYLRQESRTSVGSSTEAAGIKDITFTKRDAPLAIVTSAAVAFALHSTT